MEIGDIENVNRSTQGLDQLTFSTGSVMEILVDNERRLDLIIPTI